MADSKNPNIKHNPTIKLKTKITSEEATALRSIDLSQGEPLVDTNTKTVIIGTQNGIKADNRDNIQLGNSYQYVHKDLLENGAIISHIDAHEIRSNIYLFGIDGIKVNSGYYGSDPLLSIGTEIVGKNGVIVESDATTSKLTISVEGLSKTADGTSIVDANNIHMEVGDTEVDVNNNGVTLNKPLSVSSGGTGKNSFTNNALIVGNGSNAMKEVSTTVGALYVDTDGETVKFGTLPINCGGTGATTPSGALQNLGITATASELNKLDGATVSTTEINALKNITGNIQEQLDGKAVKSHGLHVDFDNNNNPNMDGTASKGYKSTVARSDHIHPTDISRASAEAFNDHINNKENPHEVTLEQLDIDVSADKINYLDGVSSNIQEQLNGKAPTDHAISDTTYGVATDNVFGHVKLVGGDVYGQTLNNGVAAAFSHTHSNYVTNSFNNFEPNTVEKTITVTDNKNNALILKAGTNVNLSVSNNVITIATSGTISGSIESAENVTKSINDTPISDIFDGSMAAKKAVALTSSAGSETQPIYFSNGEPVACKHKLNTTVPSNAVFTDTHYTSKNVVGATNATSNTATALTNGNVYINSVENGVVTSSHKISGSGATNVTTDKSGNIIITSTDNDTTYSAAGASLGLVRTGGDVTISNGEITVTRLNLKGAGNSKQPVYFSNGNPVACTYTLGKSVPSDAKFTDTTYTFSTGASQGQFNVNGTNYTINNLSNSSSPSFSTVTAANFYSTSDRRKKDNIVEYVPLRSILDLEVKEFDYIDTKVHTIGCIADELQQIEPMLVTEDSEGYLQINESKIVYLLLDEVKKLRKEVNDLKKG